MTTGAFVHLLESYGIPLGLVVFFIWRDWKREKEMTIIIRTLELEMREILKDLVRSTTKIIAENSAAFLTLTTVLRDRPCLADKTTRHIVDGVSNG